MEDYGKLVIEATTKAKEEKEKIEKMCEMFNHIPYIYWSNKTKISYLQRRIIVYSIMYYELSESCVSDKQFDTIAYQLIDLQRKDPESHKQSQYYYAMYDFDGSTGFDIPNRLTEHDREYLVQIAVRVLKSWRESKKEVTGCSS